MKYFSYKNRACHLGPYPYESLPRGHNIPPAPAHDSSQQTVLDGPLGTAMAAHMRAYADAAKAPSAPTMHPDDISLTDISRTLKAAGYFLDADGIGYSAYAEENSPYQTAISIVSAHGRTIDDNATASQWKKGLDAPMAQLRAMEIATVLNNQLRVLGYETKLVALDDASLNHTHHLLASGQAWIKRGQLEHPFLGAAFSYFTLLTSAKLDRDAPLKGGHSARSRLAWALGLGGTRRKGTIAARHARAAHLSLYPEESIKRVPETTTLIMEDEVPGIAKRASFFERGRRGDLGDKTKVERERFAMKETLSHSILSVLGKLVPLQKGPASEHRQENDKPEDNSQALKSLAHWMGADMSGICQIPSYAWYSHDLDGSEIAMEHENAIVIVIDQGHETMEGASGDDWVSGSQSMRAYLRAAEMTNLIAAQIRGLGYEATSHTSADGDLLHIPLIMKAGLGELSRIGEVVLNPFLGPRFKTGIISTNMPLKADQPINFNLQRFCNSCFKCARECPCDAISFSDKVMFNGYEMWKPDVERCARWRMTNVRGSSCGRCMKMCPFNQEDTWWLRFFMAAMRRLPFGHKWLADLDDKLGHGKRNPIKKWWFDLEVIKNRTVKPRGTNQRDLSLDRNVEKLKAKHKVAVYPADKNPAPTDPGPTPPNRKQALVDAANLESPSEARARKKDAV